MIRLEAMTKWFHRGGINAVAALDHIDLHVRPGDFVSIIGSNGAGKSSLLNCLAGTYPIDAGSIRLAGKDVTAWPEYRRAGVIGRVFQDPLVGTCAALSIEQNLALASRRGSKRRLAIGVRNRDRQYFRDQLAILELGLEKRLKSRVGLLSGGQRQALTMVMATLVEPQVLLLDEHTAALDPKTATQILDLTRRIVETRQLTTLMVTHNMAQALACGNRLMMLHRGRVILDVSGEEKTGLAVDDLLARFYASQGEIFASDRALLG